MWLITHPARDVDRQAGTEEVGGDGSAQDHATPPPNAITPQRQLLLRQRAGREKTPTAGSGRCGGGGGGGRDIEAHPWRNDDSHAHQLVARLVVGGGWCAGPCAQFIGARRRWLVACVVHHDGPATGAQAEAGGIIQHHFPEFTALLLAQPVTDHLIIIIIIMMVTLLIIIDLICMVAVAVRWHTGGFCCCCWPASRRATTTH